MRNAVAIKTRRGKEKSVRYCVVKKKKIHQLNALKTRKKLEHANQNDLV